MKKTPIAVMLSDVVDGQPAGAVFRDAHRALQRVEAVPADVDDLAGLRRLARRAHLRRLVELTSGWRSGRYQALSGTVADTRCSRRSFKATTAP